MDSYEVAFAWERIGATVLIAGGFTVLCDHVETFADEVELVWKAKWNVGKVLFLVIRYSIWPCVIISTVSEYREVESDRFGPLSGLVHDMSTDSSTTYVTAAVFTGIALTQILFALRTWAIWSRARWVSVLIVTLFLAGFGGEIYIVAVSNGKVNAAPGQLKLPANIKTYGAQQSLLQPVAMWLILSVFDMVLMILALIKAIEQFKLRTASTTLMTIVYRDGILYIVGVFATSIAYLGVAFLPNGLSLTFITRIQYYLYTILACRIILHLRATVVQTEVGQSNGSGTVTSRSGHYLEFRVHVTTQRTVEYPSDRTVASFGHGRTEESSIIVIGPTQYDV
ncbi:hypothetical protein EXIGLDRAFT_459145 [Exidia glandulosa HHB12029]|uniref:DUF6533 domain-containing protein n=1 Tax=Exidia glandulosa HHB12029 TaxID=1314781 RepID=A0A165PQ71_EXIGL|nr:hypothetical protein EXIGLDRAFT_459145 [Exidia glandulosa HHB12029]